MNTDSHPKMVQARVEEFSEDGEELFGCANLNCLDVFPNHCRHIFGSSITHRVRVIISGGGTIDGITSFLPHTPGVFEVYSRNNSLVSSQYIIGIADLGNKKTGDATYVHDTDNFFDICVA